MLFDEQIPLDRTAGSSFLKSSPEFSSIREFSCLKQPKVPISEKQIYLHFVDTYKEINCIISNVTSNMFKAVESFVMMEMNEHNTVLRRLERFVCESFVFSLLPVPWSSSIKQINCC